MSTNSGWFEKDLLETFYYMVEEYRAGSLDQSVFLERISLLADRYARHAGKEDVNKNQMPLFTS